MTEEPGGTNDPATDDPAGEPQPVTIEQFKEHIPEDLKGEAMWDQVTELPKFFKNYAHAQRALGGSIKIPGENATTEERTEYLEKLGRPETADAYDFKRPEGLSEGITLDEGFVERLGLTAHQLGLTMDQAHSLFSWHMTEMEQSHAEALSGMSAGMEELKSEWGGAFDRNLMMARRAIAHLGGKDVADFFENNPGLGNNPIVVKVFAKVGRMFTEAGTISGDYEGIAAPEEAEQLALSIINNPENKLNKAYHDPTDPQHDHAVAQTQKYFELAHGIPLA